MHFSAVELTLVTLATFRLSYMIALGDGSGEYFTGLRSMLGCYNYGERKYRNGDPRPETLIGRWASCPVCMSLFPIGPAVLGIASLGLWCLVTILAVAGACVLLFRWRNW